MRTCVFLLPCLMAAAMPAGSAEIPVFVIAGQSNATGFCTDYTTLPDGLKATQPNVLFLGGADVSFFGNYDGGALRLEWRPLTPPTQIEQTIQGQPGGSGGGFGPEITIGKTISDALDGQLVAEVKFTAINTNLVSQWNPNTQGPHSLYAQMRTRVQQALANLPKDSPGNTGKVAGFFWMQGEADAAPYWSDTTDDGVDNKTLQPQRTTAEYQADLINLIAHVRADFGDPNLPFVFGQITTLWGDGHSIRDAQATVAKTVPNTFMLDTENLERFPGNEGHYSNQGTVDLGIGLGKGYLSQHRSRTGPRDRVIPR